MNNNDLHKIIKILEVVLMMSLLTFLFGCAGKKPTPIDTTDLGEMPPAFVKETPDVPGKLTGIKYEYSAGSMVYHSEFAIDLIEDEIVSCEYWGRSNSDMVTKEHAPIKDTQWQDVEKAVMDLWGVWEEIPDKILNAEPDTDTDFYVLDGGGYNRWWLTWETDEGAKTIQYYYPSDRRITTLIDILQNIADGGNRKITWYEQPTLTAATYINDKTDCSFQCTWWDGENSGYRLIVRFNEGSEKVDIYDHADESIWEAARPAFEWLDPEQYPDGSYSDPVCLNLQYSDQSYKTIKLDKKTVNIIEPYLRKLTLKYLNDKQE